LTSSNIASVTAGFKPRPAGEDALACIYHVLKNPDPYDIPEHLHHNRLVINYFWQRGLLCSYLLIMGEKFNMGREPTVVSIETVAPLQTSAKCEQIKVLKEEDCRPILIKNFYCQKAYAATTFMKKFQVISWTKIALNFSKQLNETGG